MKKYKVTVIGVDFTLEKWKLEKLLTTKAFTLAKKVIKQGGDLSFGINSIKTELLHNGQVN